MKIGITQRLFLSILAATCLAILSMFLVMQWSINRGFLQYLNSLGQSRLEAAAKSLEQAYAEHGNWDFFRDNPRLWIVRIINENFVDIGAGELEKSGNGENVLPFPLPEDGHKLRLPLVVLDAEHKPLFGDFAEAEEATFEPIVHNNETVGYVGLLPPRQFLNPLQLRFLKQQKSALILAAFGMVLAVAIFSIPLARRLVRPIRAMAAATRDLASGQYSIRVPVSSSDELGQLARDFNAMALTLEKNEKMRRQLVADVSHELRTPLAVLRGEIEALLEGIRSTTPEAIRSLHTETLRLNRLVDDLYQLALSDLGALDYRKEDLDLAEVLRDSIESHFGEFERKNIKVKANIAQDVEIKIFADRRRLQQLFGNLLDNSLKYTDIGGELVIRLACGKDQAVIDFEDSAPGVSDGEINKLFDRFYRTEESRSRASGGAGLGLAISKNIVEAHAGTITAYPSPLGGILIRVMMPVAGRRP